ncbi:MAG: hypothetical protein ACRD2T_14325 [Thermoanaerobaculia bacterium]
MQWTFVVERGLALIGHTGSRGLIWLGTTGAPWCAAVALATFTLVDGVAAYGWLRKWDWLEIRTWRRSYGLCAAVGILELLLFAAVSLARA